MISSSPLLSSKMSSMSLMSQSPTPGSLDSGTSSACGASLSSAASTASDSEPEMPAPTITNGVVTKCMICQETFTIPKVLSCFHTFCQPCLAKDVKEKQESLLCPTCNVETHMPNGVPGLLPDYAVSNILEANAMENASLYCTGCKSKDTNAVARCYDCANFLCGNCVMAHQFMHCFEGHRVTELDDLQNKDHNKMERAIKCSRHKDKAMCFFCRTCNTPICQECTLLEHARGHEFEFIGEALRREAEMMQQLADQAKVKANDLRSTAKNIEHSTNRLQVNYDKACNEVHDTYAFYVSMLDERKAEALKELESAFNTKKVELSSTAQKMQSCIEELYHGADFVDKITKHAGMTEILMSKKFVETKMSSSMAYCPEVNLSNATDMEFVSNFQAIQAGARNTFGYVRQSHDGNKIQPIARPSNGFCRGLAPAAAPMITLPPPVPSTVSTSLSNGFAHLTNGNFDHFNTASTLLNSKQNFPSNSSISTIHSTNTADSLGLTNPYKEWSNGDFYQSQQIVAPMTATPDIFSTCNDPIIDMTSKMVNANIYPPKSQIKRQKMIYHCKFGEFGVSEGQFTEPSGVAVNEQNDIIVADTNNHRIQIFDKEGRFKFQFGECGKRDGQLLYPNRVAVVRSSGDIVVTERSPTHQVQVYNQYGQFVRKFGANILQHPRGVTVDNKGRIIIVECKVMRVIIFDQMGNTLHKFSCSKHLEFPNGVVVNNREEIFISDNRAHCVKVFSYQGVFLRQIGGEGITNYPIGVGINSAGEVLIADNHNNFNLTMFTQDGQLVNALESKVKHAQCFDVSLMIDDASIVLASKDYRLYIYRYAQVPALPPQHM